MASKNQQHLARPISAVKRLSRGITLSSSYYSDIKLFLFGTSSTKTITKDNLPTTGIHNKVTSSGITPGISKDVLVPIEGVGKTRLQRADITNTEFIRKLSDKDSGINGSNYLFPSDLVSILISLAKKFYENGYNKPALQEFAHSGDNLALVKKWGKPQSIEETEKEDFFLERNIFTGDGNLKGLLKAVVDAALEYEESKRVMGHDGFISESDLKRELAEIFVSEILLEFKEYDEKIKDESETKFVEASKKIKEEIEEMIKDNLHFFEKLLTTQNKESFKSQELYYEEQQTFKLNKNSADETTILDTDEYDKFKKEAVYNFLDKHKTSLILRFIDPLFVEEEAKTGSEKSPDEDDGKESGDTQEDQVSEDFTIDKDQFRQQAKKDLANIVLNNFLDQITDPRFSNFREILFTSDLTREYSISLLGLIDSDISSYVSASSFFPTNLEENLKKEGLINEGGVFINTLFESDWYSNFLNQTSLSNFLTLQGGDYFNNLFTSKITPALDILEREQGSDDISPVEKPSKKTSESVVPPVPSKDKTQPTAKDVLEGATLTSDQKHKIQYEAGWMYNRAVYEMFTAHGIEIDDVDTKLLENLRSDIYGYAAEIDQDKLLSMLGSASKRQEALLKFYPEFANKHSREIEDFHNNLANNPSFNKLNPEQKEKFLEFNKNFLGGKTIASADKLIQNSISEAIGIDVENFIKEDTNIQNTLDAMILQYGIDQEYFVKDENGQISLIKGAQNEHDVIKVIESMSDGKFALVFGLPEGTSSEKITALKKSLTNYTTYRASELSFHIQDTSLSKGLMTMNSKDIAELQDSGSKTSIKHLQFTDNTRRAILAAGDENGKNGTEVVASGLDGKTVNGDLENGTNSRRREKINKLTRRYKTFIPLWANLSSEERQIIYNKFGIPYDRSNKDVILPFIPEFILFDISTLDTFKNIKGGGDFSEEQQRLYAEFIEKNKELGLKYAGDQLENEQKFARFAQDEILYLFDDEQLLSLADYINEGEALDSRPVSEFFDGYSTRELMVLEQHIQDTGYSISKNNRHFSRSRGLMERARNSPLGKKMGFGKKSPSNRLSKTLKNSASKLTKKLTSAIDKLPPNWATTFLKIAKRIGFKRTAMIVVGALGALFGLLMSFIPGWVRSILGIGGSEAGGITAVNMATTNTASASTSAAAAAEALTNTSANLAEARAAQAATAAKIAQASGVFFGLPIALLAPGIAMFIGLIVTIHTIFIIQSAFLVQTPPGLKGSFMGSGNPLNCSDTDNLSIVEEPIVGKNSSENPGGNKIANAAYKIAEKLEQGFWCYWNRNPEKPEIFNESEYARYPYHCVYNNSTPENCDGDYKDLRSAESLYWCTWLVRDAYGVNFSTGAQGMADQFRSKPGYTYKDINSLRWNDIYPGDAWFLYNEIDTPEKDDDAFWIGHVAIVVSVSRDAIITVDSNSYYKANIYTVGANGKIQINSMPGLWVAGIGYKTSAARP